MPDIKIHTQKTQEMVDIDGPRERTLIVEVRCPAVPFARETA